MPHLVQLLSCLVLLQGIHAVEYVVTNSVVGTPGGTRFDNEIGTEYSKQTLESAADFIWSTFRQTSTSDRKNVEHVSMFVDNNDIDGAPAYTNNNEIHVSAGYIAGYSGDVRTEITGVLIHEATHIWQYGQAPGGIIEGVADYVRLKAGFAPSHWVQPGGGDRWDQGYDVTARFLDYCNSLRDDFVAQLNNKMRTQDYSNDFFLHLLGKTVDQLWTDYKAKYTN